jgi:hypothetical protein
MKVDVQADSSKQVGACHVGKRSSKICICSSLLTLSSLTYSTRVSNELGAGNPRAASLAVYVVMSMSVFQATIVSSILLALRFKWGWMFTNEAEVVHYVGTIMPFLACIALLDGIQGVLSGINLHETLIHWVYISSAVIRKQCRLYSLHSHSHEVL